MHTNTHENANDTNKTSVDETLPNWSSISHRRDTESNIEQTKEIGELEKDAIWENC